LPAGTAYTTAVGGYQRIVLDDGSVLQLNTNTKLRVALSEVERRVQLDHGEAYFEVTRDVARPFIVRAGSRRIVAVGTQFSVRRDSGDVRVSVTEGTVRLAGDELVGEEGRADPEAGADPRRMHTSEAALLPAGTIVRISSAGTVRVEHRPLPEVESQLTWRTGTLVFHNQPLGEVVTEINRYNRRHFVITDPALATLSFGGNLKPTDPQSLIDALRPLDIQADEGPNTVTLRHHSP
jgi:transmembrane sensor